MTDLERARQIVAGFYDTECYDPDYSRYFREGAYDEDRIIKIALASINCGRNQQRREAIDRDIAETEAKIKADLEAEVQL